MRTRVIGWGLAILLAVPMMAMADPVPELTVTPLAPEAVPGAVDLTTLLSKFLNDLNAGAIGTTLSTKFLAKDGTAAAPSLTFASGPTNGLFTNIANSVSVATNGTVRWTTINNHLSLAAATDFGWASSTDPNAADDTILARDAANTLALKNGTNAQTFRIYGSTTGPKYALLTHDGSAAVVGANSGSVYLQANGSNYWLVTTSGQLQAAAIAAPAITAGADATVVNTGSVNRLTYKATVTAATCTNADGFKKAATTADCTIATLPAKTRLVAVYADVTAAFTCSGTCTGTKTIAAGKTAGGTEILASGLDVATTATYGLADANLGTGMTRAGAIQGGYLPSWTATTPVIVRFTSGTGNWGDGSVTFVNAGSITFYLVTEVLP